MAIPAFDDSGNLPEGPHDATPVEIRERLVDAFDGSPAPALQALAEVVVGRAISLDITTVASGGASRGVRMDRAAAQRLVAAGAGNDADADDQ
jgi:hypothetical protein